MTEMVSTDPCGQPLVVDEGGHCLAEGVCRYPWHSEIAADQGRPPNRRIRSLMAEATANDLLVPPSNLRYVWRWPRILRILHTWPEFW